MLHKRLVFPVHSTFLSRQPVCLVPKKVDRPLKRNCCRSAIRGCEFWRSFFRYHQLYFATSEGAANGIHSRAVVNPLCPGKILDQFIASGRLYTNICSRRDKMSGAPGVMNFF